MTRVMRLLHSATARGYGCTDCDGVVRLYRVAALGGAGVAGGRLRTICGSAGEVDESEYAATLKDPTEFYGFLFEL